MNPSSEDFMNAIETINARNIFIFPNNSNIIMAANQAKELSEKNIVVIPTKNTPQGFTALVSFNGDASVEENEEAMMESLSLVKSGQVTYAVRDTVMNDVEVKLGNKVAINPYSFSSSVVGALSSLASINVFSCWSFIFSIFIVNNCPYAKASCNARPGSLVWTCTFITPSSPTTAKLSPYLSILSLVYEGMLEALKGSPIEIKDSNSSEVKEIKAPQGNIATEDIKFHY